MHCLLSGSEVAVISYNWSLNLQGSTSSVLWSVRHFKFFQVKSTCSPWSFSGWICHLIQWMTWSYLPYLGGNWCLWKVYRQILLWNDNSCRSMIICIREARKKKRRNKKSQIFFMKVQGVWLVWHCISGNDYYIFEFYFILHLPASKLKFVFEQYDKVPHVNSYETCCEYMLEGNS